MLKEWVIFLSVRLFLLALVAYSGALVVNSLIAIRLTPPALSSYPKESLSQKSKARRPLSYYAVVYTRDIFNSVKSLAQNGKVSSQVNGTLPLRLWGTAAGNNVSAFAIIEDLSSHAQGLYREGDTITAEIKLAKVEWDRVILQRDGVEEALILPKESSSVAPAAATAPSVSPLSPHGIRQVNQDSYLVDRREVEYAIGHPNKIFTQARAVPYFQDGAAQGFRLFAVKPKGVVARMGLKNGDVVQRVNGVELTDPSTALSLLQDLQGQPRIQVDLMRNSQPTTLTYEVR
jgi:general secretion pathway protein C